MTRPRGALMLVLALAVSAAEARAQGPAAPFLRRHAIEVDVGGAWLGGVDFGTAEATLTRNQTPRAPYTLFATTSSLQSPAAFEGRVGVHLTSVVAVEGAFLFSRPALETKVSADAEGAPSLAARETLSQFLVDVSAVVHLRRARFGRLVPFVLGGAGYLRELHEGDVLAQSGHTYHLGGGVKVPLLRRHGFVRALGVRIDGRVYFRSGGADLDDSSPTRTTGGGGASLILEL